MATFNGALIGQNITGTKNLYRTSGFVMNESAVLTGNKQQRVINGLFAFGTQPTQETVEVTKTPRTRPLEYSWKKL